VIGEADPGAAAAVFSLIRLRAGGEALDRDEVFGRRSTIEAIHELAHTYGLGHCDDAGVRDVVLEHPG
jgi:predicted Zn-dependent protease